MSLLYWLPMLGTLENQGLSAAQPVNHGATVSTSGKLGKCYDFSGTAQYIDTGFKESFGTGDFSISVWFKLTDSGSRTYQPIISNKTTGAASVGCAIYYNHSRQKFLWSTADGSGATQVWMAQTYSYSGMLNTWHHIVMVRNSSDAKKGYFYIDGVRYELASVPAIRNVTNTTYNLQIGDIGSHNNANYLWTGSLCDLRIYDTALSPREIKEISKGLILHYPLNREGFGADNLVNGLYAGGRTIVNNGIVTALLSQNLDCYFHFTCSEDLLAENEYTISMDVSGFSGPDKYLVYGIINQNSGQNITMRNGKCFAIFSPSSNITAGTKIIIDDLNRATSGLTDLTIKNIKVEHGSIPTPWTPAPSDELYSKMGLDNNIEYDVSGYGHNGTESGNITVSSDTPRYTCSSEFDGSSYITADILPEETKSVSFWLKTTYTSGNYVVFADLGSRMAFGFNNSPTTYIVCCGSTSGSTGSKCIANADQYKVGEWNHVVVVKTGTNTYTTYINGVACSPNSTNYWTHSTNNLMVGRRSTGSNFKGFLSDFRAYATQLSEDDILELYQVGASLANNGVLMAHEFIE